MNRIDWGKEFKDCKHKTVDAQRQTHGNILCGYTIEHNMVVNRCTYRNCPLRVHELKEGYDVSR